MVKRATAGRPEVTSHAEIEQAAFRLFSERGFAATTLDDIARAVGVGRRTLFRYYPSKNDIPWGQFDRTLESFAELLAAEPTDVAIWEAVHRGVRRFNEFPLDARPTHRERMALILTVPALQAHSVLRYEEWRGVIATYVAGRLGQSPRDLVPQTIGQVSLAITLTAYETWLAHDGLSLDDLIDAAMTALRDHVV